MAKISLRAYNKEIESLVDRGQYEQALAHCRHILKYYPKHIDSYRLMAKAYMEAQRYGDASDVFQRVLSSVPDDFVSHLGMSIIREDEGNLDAAIWHMERAFEIQPANAAIQGELRRLYGRRDGIEPPKVRLTRGALARMYFKGELYQQAISELHGALATDPTRTDLQLLLAQCYFRSNQRVDAADTCTAILKKLPYCIEANRILFEILASSDRAQDAPAYRQRAIALNPYLGQISPKSTTPDKVPDEAVYLDKLEWTGSPESAGADQPQWASSLGIQIETPADKAETVPDWLSALDSITQTPTDETGDIPKISPFTPAALASEPELAEFSDKWEAPQETAEQELIPDWMKEAGWEPSSSSSREAEMGYNLDEQAGSENQELSPAEIPSWLKAIAPKEALEEQEESAEEIDQRLVEALDSAALPWLEETPPGPTDTIAAWLEDKDVPTTRESAPGSEAQPDWLEIADADKGSALGAAMPGLEVSGAEEPAPVIGSGVPDWLIELEKESELAGRGDEPSSGEEEELPDWLRSETAATPVEEGADLSVGEAETTPEMVEGEALGDEFSPPVIEEAPVALPEEAAIEVVEPGETLPWEETLESETLAEGEVPDWLAELGPAMADQETALTEEAAVEAPGLSVEEEDAAFAWLEGLAAKQGASEALLLSPEERLDLPPEWVQKEAAEADLSPEPGGIEETAIDLAEGAGRELPVVEAEEAAIKEEPVEIAGEPASAIPAEIAAEEWTPEVFEAAEEQIAEMVSELEPTPPESLPDWLRQAGKEAEAELPAITEGGDLPDWLRKMEEGEEAEAEEESWIPVMEGGAPTEPALDWLTTSDELEEIEDKELAWLTEVSSEDLDIPLAATAESVEATIEGEWQPEEQLPSEEIAEMPEEPEALAMEPTVEEADILKIEEPPVIAEDTKPSRLLTAEGEQPAGVGEPTGEEVVPTVGESEDLAEGAPTGEQEMEAAFAWLESLAVRQGADEALMYTEEERSVEPPEWVQAAAVETTAEVAGGVGVEKEFEEVAAEDAPTGIPGVSIEGAALEEPPIVSEEESLVGVVEPVSTELEEVVEITPEVEEAPFIEAEGLEAEMAAGEMAAALEPVEQATAEEEIEVELEVEAPPLHEAPAEIQESVPELPDWLADLETETEVSTSEEGWAPPEITKPEPVFVDLNQASLVELERLPGIGFVRAQALVDYRASNGDLTSLEDLTKVEGFDADVIEGLRGIAVFPEPVFPEQVLPEKEIRAVTVPEEKEAEEVVKSMPLPLVEEVTYPLPEGDESSTLLEARASLETSDVQAALVKYQALIQSDSLLPEVVKDMHEALYRFPVDLSLWMALGDAQMRAGQIQEALDAYTKAEELMK